MYTRPIINVKDITNPQRMETEPRLEIKLEEMSDDDMEDSTGY